MTRHTKKAGHLATGDRPEHDLMPHQEQQGGAVSKDTNPTVRQACDTRQDQSDGVNR